jgi:hypothetical protein
MAEALRNEVAITLAGQERTMRATFAAMRGIEQAMGVSVLALVQRALKRELGVTDTTVIIFNGLKGADDTRLSLEQVGEAVVEEGLNALAGPVVEFIGKSMAGVKVGKPEPAVS